jgi:FkbM family methyltransferase
MALLRILKFILTHPLNQKKPFQSLLRFFKWQINIRLNPYPIIFSFAEKSKLILVRGLTGATGNLYCGLHEFEDMAFVLHFLRGSDLFVDIGANVGSYTLLAGNEREAQTVSIEPIPSTFNFLKTNVALNNIQRNVKCLNIGLGSAKGVLSFTASHDTMNHVATNSEFDTINVNIERFDDIISIEKTCLIKMDVEGFEAEVIKGMNNALQNPSFKALIIELNGSGKRYGFDDASIHTTLVQYGFNPYAYLPFNRELRRLTSYGAHNTIYIRDISFVSKRIKDAECFHIHDNSF